MPRRKSLESSNFNTFIVKSNNKKTSIGKNFLLDINPITETQKKFYDAYDNNKHIVAHGVPGSGKTFSSIYKALQEVFDETSEKECVYIVRSLVQTRSIGFMPGSENEKQGYFETPYRSMVKHMFQLPSEADFDMLYDTLKSQKTIKFYNTSFLRGLTFDDCVLVVDEFSNMNFHELSSIITRVGQNCRIIFSGDAEQSDLISTNEKNGIHDFMRILQIMPSFEILEFGIDDICRSGLVKEFILAKRELGL